MSNVIPLTLAWLLAGAPADAPKADAPKQNTIEIKHARLVLALAWSPDGKRLASAADDGSIRVSESLTGKELVRLETGSPVTGMVFSPDGKVLGIKSGSQDGPLVTWDIDAKKKLKQLAFKGYACNQLAFTPDGQTMVASGPGENMVWNHAKGGGSGSKSAQVPGNSSAAVSADGSLIAWCNPQGLVNLYFHIARKHQRMQIGPALAFALSPDARLLVSSHADTTLRLWDVAGSEIRKFEGLRAPARLVHFSANGKMLAAASPGDPVVRIWDVDTGRMRRRLAAGPAGSTVLALAPDGRSLAMATGNAATIWSVATRDLGPLGEAKPAKEAELLSAWEDLASADSGKAEFAFRRLAEAQHHALDFLKSRVRTVAVPQVDWKHVEQLLRELDDPAYPLRQRATTELAKFGEIVRPALEKYISSMPSLEGERRARKLLDRVRDLELTPDRLRCLETIEILEILATPQSRGLLDEIARDALLAQIRMSAQEAVRRLGRKE